MNPTPAHFPNIRPASAPRGFLGLSPRRLKRAIRLGLRSLWLHRLRSLLTVLGIVFGVCSVIAMLAIGEGASHEAQEQIRNLGSQNIILTSVKPPEELKVSGNASSLLEYGITYLDLRRMRATIPGVTIVVPGRIMREYVWNINRRVDCEIVGTVPWYPEMRNHRVAQGRFFTDVEMEDNRSVCVIGTEMVPWLFPLESPLGKTVRVGSAYYRVIGVMEPRAKGKGGDNQPGAKGGGRQSDVYSSVHRQSALGGNHSQAPHRQFRGRESGAPRSDGQGVQPRGGRKRVARDQRLVGPGAQEAGLRDDGADRIAQARGTYQTDL